MTGDHLAWVCERLKAEGKTALLLIRHNAAWHVSKRVRAWTKVHNRRAKADGGVRVVAGYPLVKNPWLNPIEPKWGHGKKAIVEPDRLLTASGVRERVRANYAVIPKRPEYSTPKRRPHDPSTIPPSKRRKAPDKPARGGRWKDDRVMLNGIFWRLNTGAPWRDLPDRYGPWPTVYGRFAALRQTGLLDRIIGRLQLRLNEAGLIDPDLFCVDGTNVRAARAAAGAAKKKGPAG